MERSHLLAEARGWGMPERVAQMVITNALERFDVGLADADAAYPGTPPGMRDVVRRQFERLARSGF